MSKKQRPRRQSNKPTVVEQARPQEQRAPRTPNIRPGATNFKPVSDVVTNQMLQHLGPQANQAYMYAPGAPIKPIPGLTPETGPRGWNYPIGYNIAQLPRSTEQYGFADLRAMASSYYGIQLAQQVWFDYVSKLEMVIEPRPELMDEKMDISLYEDDIQMYQDFFAYPDKDHDLHSWLQMAVKDQLEIDAVAIYVRKDRIGRPFALDLIDGSMIKPLIDDRGRKPMPPWPAFEQFAYGLPSTFLTNDDLIYLKETERTDSVYGRSRVEKIILNINIALRKLTKDLAHFTDGNLPPGFVTPSMDVQWSQEEIESWEMQLNNLMAGNDELRARLKVLPRGFEYKSVLDPDIHVDMDKFILNITAACHGLTMAELAFTDDVNRATGETQENVVYRRAMGPLMARYAKLFTFILHKFFKETRFIVKWRGFSETEDFASQASAYSTLVTAGIQSPTQAAHAMHLPVYGDIEVPPFQMTKTGPIMIDDLADPEVRAATKAAFIAGASPQQPPKTGQPAPGGGSGDDEDEDTDDEGALDSAMDEAEQSLTTLGSRSRRFTVSSLLERQISALLARVEAIERSDPARGPNGEFGDFASTKQSTGHKGRKSGAKTKKTGAPKPKVPTKQRMGTRTQKLATRFQRLAARQVDAHWTAAQAQAAGKLSGIFGQISSAISSGKTQSVDGLLDSAWAQAKTLFAGNTKSLGAMSHALTALDNANSKGLLRFADVDSFDAEDLDGDDDLADEDDDLPWIALDEALSDDESEEDEPPPSRVSDALERIEDQLRAFRAQNVTPEIAREDVPTEHTGMMLAFMLDPETAAQLAIPGGESIEDMHVTLAYLGNKDEVDLDVPALIDALTAWASEAVTLQGSTGGLGRFTSSESSDGMSPVIALVNVPGLQQWRTSLVQCVEGIGVEVAKDFEYTPHITLKYVPDGAPMPIEQLPAIPLAFDTLCLAIGNERTFFRLGENLEQKPYKDTEGQTGRADSPGRGTDGDARTGAQPADVRDAAPGPDRAGTVTAESNADVSREVSAEYRRWRSRSLEDVKAGRPWRGFTTSLIPEYAHAFISRSLEYCQTADEVRALFKRVQEQGEYPKSDFARDVRACFENIGSRAEALPSDASKAALIHAYQMTSADEAHLATILAHGYLSAKHAAYQRAVNRARLHVTLASPWQPGPHDSADARVWGQQRAQGIAHTYATLLEHAVTGAFSAPQSAPPERGIISGIGNVLSTVKDWFLNLIGWKSDQVSDDTWNEGDNDGTEQWIGDAIKSGDDYSRMRVRVLPETSSGDYCADFAGRDFSFDDIGSSVPNFPTHSNCVHFLSVYVVNANGDEEEVSV